MINSFRKTGFYNFGSVLNKKKCQKFKRISNLRKLDKKSFIVPKRILKKGRFSKISWN